MNHKRQNEQLGERQKKRLKVAHAEVPPLVDLALHQLSRNLNECTQLHRLPAYLLNRLLKLFETDASIQNSLRSLTLAQCALTNEMLKPMQYLSNLQTLCISNCGDITGVVLAYLGKLPHLHTLKLNRCRKASWGFYFLQNQLTTLEVAFCEIESPVVSSITQITSLTALNMMGNRISDEGLEHLADLKHLTDLNVSMNSSLTDRCLPFIRALPCLKTLNLSFCTNVSADGLKIIKSHVQIECVGCNKSTSEVHLRPIVLLAEDDRLQQKIISRTLKRYNFDVEIAENGEVALEMYKSGKSNYDLILMDVMMPLMDGISCVKKIREEEEILGRKRIPIIIQTADTREGQVSIYKEAGCDVVLPKPLDKEVITLATTLLKR